MGITSCSGCKDGFINVADASSPESERKQNCGELMQHLTKPDVFIYY